MDKALRVTASIAVLLGLSGCNTVVSKEPWFTAADAEGAPDFRDGLWVSADTDCRFNEAKPAERWPDCAEAFFVRGEERWSMRWDDTDARSRHRRTFAGWQRDQEDSIIANGDPLIDQIDTESEGAGPIGDPEAEPEATVPLSDDAGVGVSEPASQWWRFAYVAIRPVQYDDEGKVTLAETWSIKCGPLPELLQSETAQRRSRARKDEPEDATVTDRPFPGLTVVEDDCIAESVEALRRAAVLSENLGERNRSHWVRDGWR